MATRYTKLDWAVGPKDVNRANLDYMENGIVNAKQECFRLSDIGLSDADFSPTDWAGNALILINAMSSNDYMQFKMYVRASVEINLITSIRNSNTVATGSDGMLQIRLYRNGNYTYTADYTNQFEFHQNNSSYTILFGAYDNLWRGWSRINMTDVSL